VQLAVRLNGKAVMQMRAGGVLQWHLPAVGFSS